MLIIKRTEYFLVCMKNFFIVFFCALLLTFSNTCTTRKEKKLSLKTGDTLYGYVIAIIDGDTYDILIRKKKTHRIRMEGIDAPERGMPFYRVSKDYLSQLCFNKKVKLKITGFDSNKRLLGYTYLDDGTELSQEMIKSGLAWHFKKYNTDSVLSMLEIEARTLKKGIWIHDNPMPPWVNRSLHRQGISTKDSFKITESQE